MTETDLRQGVSAAGHATHDALELLDYIETPEHARDRATAHLHALDAATSQTIRAHHATEAAAHLIRFAELVAAQPPAAEPLFLQEI